MFWRISKNKWKFERDITKEPAKENIKEIY